METIDCRQFNCRSLDQSLRFCSKLNTQIRSREKINHEYVTFSGLEHTYLVSLILVSRTVVLCAVNNLPCSASIEISWYAHSALLLNSAMICLHFVIIYQMKRLIMKLDTGKEKTVASFFLEKRISCVLSESFLEKQFLCRIWEIKEVSAAL